jgi:hypothetical protein
MSELFEHSIEPAGAGGEPQYMPSRCRGCAHTWRYGARIEIYQCSDSLRVFK